MGKGKRYTKEYKDMIKNMITFGIGLRMPLKK